MKKRLCALFLSLCMALALLPGTALAEEETPDSIATQVMPQIEIAGLEIKEVVSTADPGTFSGDTANLPIGADGIILHVCCNTAGYVYSSNKTPEDLAAAVQIKDSGCGLTLSNVSASSDHDAYLYFSGPARPGELEITLTEEFFTNIDPDHIIPVPSNSIYIKIAEPAPVVKTTPAVEVTPDNLTAGADQVRLTLFCPTEGVELDWRPLERVYYGDGQDPSKVSRYITSNASDLGLTLSGVDVDWDNNTVQGEGPEVYPSYLYPDGVCPVSNLILTFSGTAKPGTLEITLAGSLFVQCGKETAPTVLSAASEDLFYPVRISIPIQGSSTEDAAVAVTFSNQTKGSYDARVDAIPAALITENSEVVLIPAYTGSRSTSYAAVTLDGSAVETLFNNGAPVPAQVTTDLGAVHLSSEVIAELYYQMRRAGEVELTLGWDADAIRMAMGKVSKAEAYEVQFTGFDISGLSEDGRILMALPTEITDPVVFCAQRDGSYESLGGTYRSGMAVFATEHLSTFVIVPKEEGKKLTAAPATPEEPKEPEKPAETEKPVEPVPEKPAPLPFTDVAENAWYQEDVRYVYENKMMNGDGSDSIFNPDGTTTRAMLVTVLYRLEGEPEAGRPTFYDVAEDQWYAAAVSWAAENGIVGGRGDGFDPMGIITRQDFATILYRYAGTYKGYDVTARADLSAFPDEGSIAEYAAEAMRWANSLGLIQGSGGELDPAGSATRAQTAAILARFCRNRA